MTFKDRSEQRMADPRPYFVVTPIAKKIGSV